MELHPGRRAATGGALAARAGPRAAAGQALIGGVLLAAIEGVSIMVNEWFAPQPDQGMAGDMMGNPELDEQKLAPPSF